MNETDSLARRRYRFGTGFKVTESGTEIRVDLEPGKKSPRPKGAAGEIFQCRIVSISFSDYLVCHVIDEDGEQQDSTYVAKPWFLRGSDTWDGRTRVNVTYSNYAGNYNIRRAVAGFSAAKTQYLIPEYALNDIIFAMSCKATGVSRLNGDVSEPVEMIDVNADGRMWANV